MWLLWAALGWVAGIGLNALVHELPRSDRLLARPRCTSCERLLPVSALTVLRRRARTACPSCSTPVLHWGRTLEWPTALAFGAIAWCYAGQLPALLIYSWYALVLLVVLAIDLHHRWVYTIVCYPAILAAAILTPVVTGTWWSGLVGAAIGAGLFLALYGIGRLAFRGREAMAVGDITIATMIGAMVGAERALAALFIGVALVGVVAVLMLVLRRASVGDFIPYGAGLCLGAFVGLLMGCPSAG
jgi:prepilin signal peptidase PulO-like enzyme (type II secretory pathway)